MEGKSFALSACCSFLAVLGGACLLGAGIHVYNVDPNKIAFAFPRTDGKTSENNANDDFGTVFGVGGFPNFFSAAISCDGITSSFARNESYQFTKRCRLQDSELKRDVDGDGEEGDDQGYVFPNAEPELVCGDYIVSGTEVCRGTVNGCPTNTASKYYENEVLAAYRNTDCKNSQVGRDLLIGDGVLVLLVALMWVAWVLLSKKEHPRAQGLLVATTTLTTVAMVLTGVAMYFFLEQAPAARELESRVNCAAMSEEQYFGATLRPVSKCRVADEECDPLDFEGPTGIFGSNQVGTCEYYPTELVDVNCGEVHVDSQEAREDESCDPANCEFVGATFGDKYQSECCRARRKCCGDDAKCGLNSVCEWLNETSWDHSALEEASEQNTCANLAQLRSTECTDEQRQAFENRLRTEGVCFPSALTTSSTNAGSNAANDLKCKPDGKKRLLFVTDVVAAKSSDPSTQKLTEEFVEPLLDECQMQTLFPSCQTRCLVASEAACPETLPMIGSPSNCTWQADAGLCTPTPGAYDTDELKNNRPTEFCESLMTDADEDANKAACLAQSRCFWARDGAVNRCVSRDCPGTATGAALSYSGYQRSQNPPCQAQSVFDGGLNRGPGFKVCKDPTKGCLPSGESANCVIRGEYHPLSNPDWYYSSSGLFDLDPPTSAMEIPLCAALVETNCTSLSFCALVQDGDTATCRSVFEKCDGAPRSQYNTDKGVAAHTVAFATAGTVGGVPCLNDRSGTFTSPIMYELYLTWIFYVAGAALTFLSLVTLIFMSAMLGGVGPGGVGSSDLAAAKSY